MPDPGNPTTNPTTPSLADAAASHLQSTPGATPPSAATFAPFKKFVGSLPPSEKVSEDKLYSLVRQGKLPVYRLPGVKPACVNVEEARAVLANLRAAGKLRTGYGSFGPDAVVRDLSNVAGQTFRVDQ